MKYGYCLDVKFLDGDKKSRAIFDAVVKAGFDYVELPLSALSELSDEKVSELKEELKKIPCLACNLFFPQSVSIAISVRSTKSGAKAYLRRMLPFAESLGVETLVFGNGGARKIPEGSTRQSTMANLRSLVEKMDSSTRTLNICVEPLNHTETDIVNSYGEAVRLSKNLPNVGAMIDSYHVAMENQNYDDVLAAPTRMWHLHTAYPVGRFVPSPNDNMSLYAGFVKAVQKVGYDGKISIEGALRAQTLGEIDAEVEAALGVVKGLFE